MAFHPKFITYLIFILLSTPTNALIPSNSLNNNAPKAISELKEAVVRGLGFQSEDLEVSGFDVRDALVGQAVAYEFDIEIDNKVVPIKLLEDVGLWEFVDRPFFEKAKTEGEELNSLAEVGKGGTVLSPFELAGPMELWIQDGDDLRLSLPHDVDAGAVKKVVLSDGAVVTVKGAKSVSLRHPIELPLPLNRTHPKNRFMASGLLTMADALRHASRSNQKHLLSLRIVGPTSLASPPSASPSDKLKLKRLAPGLVELSARSLPAANHDSEYQSGNLWPVISLNGSEANLRGLEELLASVLGKKESEEGSFKLLKAQASAHTYMKMSFAVERNFAEGEVDWSTFPSWKTRPEKAKAHFEVLARVDDSGEIIPERIAQVKPFESEEVIIDSLQTGNLSFSKTEIVFPPPDYFTL